jgi:hypothetical protein
VGDRLINGVSERCARSSRPAPASLLSAVSTEVDACPAPAKEHSSASAIARRRSLHLDVPVPPPVVGTASA